MKPIFWNEDKNAWLKQERDVSFEDVAIAIQEGFLLETLTHPNKEKYAGQKIYVVNINSYIYLVPFIEDDEKVFLKTIIPSRKATQKYLIKGKEKI